MEKTCPLRLSAASSPDLPLYADCEREECEWFINGTCAIIIIAQALMEKKK